MMVVPRRRLNSVFTLDPPVKPEDDEERNFVTPVKTIPDLSCESVIRIKLMVSYLAILLYLVGRFKKKTNVRYIFLLT